MTLVKFNDPFAVFPSILDNFMGQETDAMLNWSTNRFSMPAVNVKEDDNGFSLEIAAPGLKKDDFKITLDNGVLTISAGKQQENEEKQEGRYTKREFSYQSFARSFALPRSVDGEKIDARYQDGILHLDIPKKEEAKRKAPKMIEIA